MHGEKNRSCHSSMCHPIIPYSAVQISRQQFLTFPMMSLQYIFPAQGFQLLQFLYIKRGNLLIILADLIWPCFTLSSESSPLAAVVSYAHEPIKLGWVWFCVCVCV